ncbi:hypothetical protein HWV62_25202 [Athelia sp. TMB]|nr:hypothetical protein HWV62_25202 [Athelia sp. TMB]
MQFAIVTPSIVETYKLLKSGNPSAPLLSAFGPGGWKVRVNCMWFGSLMMSLVAALFSIHCKQWLDGYGVELAFAGSANIWKATLNKDVRRTVRTYLWKTLHRAYKIGKYWQNITGWEQREKCQVCGEEESMEHILLECEEPGRKMVWDLAEKLWRMKVDRWPELKNIGAVLACTMADFKDLEGKKMGGANRLYRILITESAHLIWRMRNKRFGEATEETWPKENEIRNLWIASMNQRLDLDKAMTSKKFEKKAISRTKVLQTWRNTLKDEKNLPDDWTNVREVLTALSDMLGDLLRGLLQGTSLKGLMEHEEKLDVHELGDELDANSLNWLMEHTQSEDVYQEALRAEPEYRRCRSAAPLSTPLKTIPGTPGLPSTSVV